MVEDSDLLQRFVAEGSQEAFGTIVSRHLDLVYSVAMRQVAGDEQLAKEVCQAVFVSLSRKAIRLKKRRVVSGWLYCAAKFEANRAVRNEVLRRTREREAGMEQNLDAPEPSIDWEQARPLLDEAITCLKESERDAVCLRFFEKLRFKEIGEILGVSENTARMRVSRSLDKLQAMLRRKGIKSSAAAMAAALGGQITLAAPAGLSNAIATGAVASAGSGLFLSAIGIMNTTKAVGIMAGLAVAVGSAVYLSQEPDVPDSLPDQPVETVAMESSSEPPAIQATLGASSLDEDASTEFLETADERFERKHAELALLHKSGEISDLEKMIREAILNTELAISRKEESFSGVLTEEEQSIFNRYSELRKTDKEAAKNFLIANLNESSSRAMYFEGGRAFAESGERDKAVDFFKIALEKEGGHDRNLDRLLNRNLGIMLVQQTELEEAKPYFQEALYLTDKPDHTLHGLYGLAEVNTGNFVAAEFHYKKAIEMNPEVQDWSLGLSKALLNQEKYEEANAVLKALLARIAE